MLEAEIALLDQVQEFHRRRQGVPTGDGHHEAEVGPDEPVLGRRGGADRSTGFAGGPLTLLEGFLGLPALFDDLRQLTLLLSSEERHHADFVEVLAY